MYFKFSGNSTTLRAVFSRNQIIGHGERIGRANNFISPGQGLLRP